MTDTTDTPTYGDFARDLRVLANHFDALDGRLPLPRYPSQGLTIDIHTASHLDVDQAAGILDVVTRRRGGHTAAALGVGTVTLSFVHVTDAAMAEHKARQDFAKTMPVQVPRSLTEGPDGNEFGQYAVSS